MKHEDDWRQQLGPDTLAKTRVWTFVLLMTLLVGLLAFTF